MEFNETGFFLAVFIQILHAQQINIPRVKVYR